MKLNIRNFRILSVLFVAGVLAMAPLASSAQQASDKLNQDQLTTLIATAKTPADHQRIAHYYSAKAADYAAEAKEHEAMVAAYKANPSLVNNKNQFSTINHCQYFVKSLNDLAIKSRELAALHERMASEVR